MQLLRELGWRVTRTCRISVISRPIGLKITIKFIYYLGLHYTHLYIYWDPHRDSHSRILELFVENHRFRPYILCLSLRAPYVLPVSILFKFITYIIACMYGYSLSGHRAWNLECKGQGGWDPGFQVERTWWLAEISVVKTKMCFNHAVPGHRSRSRGSVSHFLLGLFDTLTAPPDHVAVFLCRFFANYLHFESIDEFLTANTWTAWDGTGPWFCLTLQW